MNMKRNLKVLLATRWYGCHSNRYGAADVVMGSFHRGDNLPSSSE